MENCVRFDKSLQKIVLSERMFFVNKHVVREIDMFTRKFVVYECKSVAILLGWMEQVLVISGIKSYA